MLLLNPTHVELTVLQANRLVVRNKNGTNNAYVTISMGKEKFQTAVLEKSNHPFIWKDQTFLLEIPDDKNLAVISVSVYNKHKRRVVDAEELLGSAYISLNDIQPSSKPKLKTYALLPKTTDSNSTNNCCGEVILSIVFRQIVFRTMRDVAEVLMENNNKKPRTSSLRNIAQSLMNERKSPKRSSAELSDSGSRRTSEEINENGGRKSRSSSLRNIAQALLLERKIQYATPVKNNDSESESRRMSEETEESSLQTNILQQNTEKSGLDRNENEIKPREAPPVPPHRKLTRVQSARGKTNTRREISNSERNYIVKKVTSRLPSSSSESESENLETETRVNALQQTQFQHPPFKTGDDDDVPPEFVAETKKNLVEMVFQLRKLLKLQDQKIADLETYIDGRLAEVMARNPSSLEI